MLGSWDGNRGPAGLAESNGSHRQVYGFGRLQVDCRGRGSASKPYARFEYWTVFMSGACLLFSVD